MKRIFLALIVLGLATGMQSCNNGDYKAEPQGNLPTPPGGNNGGGGGGGNGITGGIMSAKIDGVSFVATNGTAILNVFYGIAGQNSSGGIVLGFLAGSPAPGEYNVDASNVMASYSTVSQGTPFAGTSGKITITTNDATKVAGTFNFSDGTHNVTDGTFSINK